MPIANQLPQPRHRNDRVRDPGPGAHGDRVNAASAARWLVSKRNSQGGFGSTQDTVVALQALTEFAKAGRDATPS